MVKKATKPNPGGRPPRDPSTLRSERLVLRIHPDLMEALSERAMESGITRSLYVERALIAFVNLDPRIHLDQMGRRTDKQRQTPIMGTLGSFQKKWEDFAKVRSAVLGEPETLQPPGWVEPSAGDKTGNPEDDGI